MIVRLLVLISTSVVHCQLYDTVEVIKKFGYQAESYEVQTIDGFLLTVHRVIPKSPKNEIPCFLMHGLIESSMEFLQLQEDSLPFLLSDSGYDVYLGNSRGTQYSAHVEHSRKSSEFWDFSWHEIGFYDLPAMIDFVLNKTGSEKLNYIAISQGSTAALVLLSMRPEFNQKIHQAHFLAPAAFFKHFSPIKRIFNTFYIKTFSRHNMVNFELSNAIFSPIMHATCYKSIPMLSWPCLLIAFSLGGPNIYKVEADFDALRVFLDVMTPYVSKRQILHFLQLAESGKFRMYDYGEDENVKMYGSKQPLDYDLKNVEIPVYIYSAGQDMLATQKDVEHLRDVLPNVVDFHLIPNFNHFDFEWARGAKDEVYLRILKFLNVQDDRETNRIGYKNEDTKIKNEKLQKNRV